MIMSYKVFLLYALRDGFMFYKVIIGNLIIFVSTNFLNSDNGHGKKYVELFL
jgi:hypothetical protein